MLQLREDLYKTLIEIIGWIYLTKVVFHIMLDCRYFGDIFEIISYKNRKAQFVGFYTRREYGIWNYLKIIINVSFGILILLVALASVLAIYDIIA